MSFYTLHVRESCEWTTKSKNWHFRRFILIVYLVFIAANETKSAVVSDFSGCVRAISAIRCNPFDPDEVSSAIDRALNIPLAAVEVQSSSSSSSSRIILPKFLIIIQYISSIGVNLIN
jgi:hypothetical protein